MNKVEALRLLVAAQDDPVVAAWASVVHEHRMPPESDVSPYDHLNAFQEIYGHGLITAYQYNETDTRRIFFSGRRPMTDQIQRVLDNLRLLPERAAMEPIMSKTKFPDSPFADTNALTAKGGAAIAGTGSRTALPPTTSRAPLNPFAPSREVTAPTKQSLEPFPKRQSLACRDGERELANGVAMGDIDLRIFCCGKQLAMVIADMQADGPDSLPGGQVAVIDRVLHGSCDVCQREHHHSVGEVVEHDRFR
jgi:hypothetical protein